jgi:hypothetical protein
MGVGFQVESPEVFGFAVDCASIGAEVRLAVGDACGCADALWETSD